MKLPSRKPQRAPIPLPTATLKAEFRKPGRHGKPDVNQTPTQSIPRVARLLALAHRLDGMIRSGELKDWAEAARLIGVTRARMTQIANLMLLAPEVQDTVLTSSPAPNGVEGITELDLRPLSGPVDWDSQTTNWRSLCF